MTRAVLLAGLLAASAHAVTLREYAGGKPLRIYTVGTDQKIPLDAEDQTNNTGKGGKILPLSRKGLTSIEGIAKLPVLDEGRQTTLDRVPHLQIFLNRNQLRELPPEFFTLQNLEVIYLYDNQLGAIPPAIAKMKNLWGMYFTGNGIRAIPAEVFTMTWLKKLQVSKNRLTELPAAIGNLTELRHLDLSSNEIETVPASIERLQKLRVCSLSDNRLRQLPEEFGKVPVVHQLRVCNNPLTSLPEGFANMPGSIDITGTQIDAARLSPGLRAKIGREKRNQKYPDKQRKS